jgi:hypothetical protein
MSRLGIFIILTAILGGCVIPHPKALVGTSCASPNDRLLAVGRDIVADSAYAEMRANLKLPSDASPRWVDDDRVCARVATALARATHVMSTNIPIAVMAIGDYYLAATDAWSAPWLLDRNLEVVTGFVVPN